MATHLHAHVSTASVDCDGPLYRELISSLNDAERAEHEQAQGVNDFHDLHFKARILAGHVSFSSEQGVNVRVDEDGFTAFEQTDEGHRRANVRWCEDRDCDPTAASQRDVFAEQMGY